MTSDLELKEYCEQTAARAKAASAQLALLTGQQKNDWLVRSAGMLRRHVDRILAANQRDLEAAPGYGLTAAQVDRLKLTVDRVEAIAVGMEQIAMLPDPVGEMIDSSIRPNGLRISKVRVPLGVVFFIYESRPNVTADAAAICVKSGNAVILRGGKEAAHSSRAIVDLLDEAAEPVRLAGWRRATRADRRSLRGQPFPRALALHRRRDPARRRKPDSPRCRRGDDAGDQAF